MIVKSITSPDIIRLLGDGAIGILPTDTIYGIVAFAGDQKAVSRLYKAKHRDGKPGTIIAASVQQLEELGIAKSDLDKVKSLWPGPISVVLPANSSLAYIHQGKESLAVRVTANETLRNLLLQTGPLLTSSANMPGEPPAKTIEEARHYFAATVDFYVDGGFMTNAAPSTVIKLEANGAKTVLRQGAVPIDNKE